MFDRGPFWSAPPDWGSARVAGPGVLLQARCAQAQLVSGAVDAWLLARGESAIGPRNGCSSEAYSLRLSSDAVLRIGADPVSVGWHDDHGIAVSDSGDAWILIDITGSGAEAVLSQGAEYPFPEPPGPSTESARMLFAGLVVAVSKRDAGWRFHVDRAWAPALWRWLVVHAGARES